MTDAGYADVPELVWEELAEASTLPLTFSPSQSHAHPPSRSMETRTSVTPISGREYLHMHLKPSSCILHARVPTPPTSRITMADSESDSWEDDRTPAPDRKFGNTHNERTSFI